MTDNFKQECKNTTYKNRLGKIALDNDTISNSDFLSSFEITDSCISNGEILGNTNAKSIKIKTLDNYNLADKEVCPFIGVKYDDTNDEYIKVGKYTIDIPKDDKTAKNGEYNGVDDLSRLDQKYICSIENIDNCTILDFYKDVCKQIGLTPKKLDFINADIPVNGNPFTNNETCRVVLQNIAQVFCTFVDIDWETNEIDLIWFDEEVSETLTKNDYSTLEKNQVYGPINSLSIKESAIDGENITIEQDGKEITDFIIKGKCEQKVVIPTNLYNYQDVQQKSETVEIGEDGWIYVNYDNTYGTEEQYANFYTNNLDLKSKQEYNIICEIEVFENSFVESDNNIVVTGRHDATNGGQFQNKMVYNLGDLSDPSIKQMINITVEDPKLVRAGLRTFVTFRKGGKVSLRFRISVLEDLSATADTFTYEPFVNKIPSIEYPSEIKTLKDELIVETNIVSNKKNLYNYQDINVKSDNITLGEDGWLYVECDNTQGTSEKYANFWTNNLDLKENTDYNIIGEIEIFENIHPDSADNSMVFSSRHLSSNVGQFEGNVGYPIDSLGTSSIKQRVKRSLTNFNGVTGGIRSFVTIRIGSKVSLRFRISVLEDTSITVDNFVYHSYIPKKISLIDLQDKELNSVNNIWDEFNIATGKLTKRIGKIDSYNGEEITANYISTTGGLDNGATIYYELQEPVEIELEKTNVELFNEINNITIDNNLKPDMIIKTNYLEEIETYTGTSIQIEKTTYELNEISIVDNYFLYTEDLRRQAIASIWDKIKGFTYVDCKITSYTGKPYLKRGNRVKVQDDDETYFDTYVLSHTFTYDGTFKSIIESPALTKTQTALKNQKSATSYFRRVERICNKIDGQLKDTIEQVNADGEKISDITQTVTDLTTTIEDNKYYIDENGNKVSISDTVYKLQQSTNGAISTISTTSGNNIFRNAIGLFQDEYWEGVCKPYTDTAIQKESGQRSCWLLQNGNQKQTVELKNGHYTISFIYKKLLELATISIKINDEIFNLTETEFTDFSKTIEIKDNTLTIEFISNTDNACYVLNLMGNVGDVAQPFSINPNETVTDTVMIGKGLEISSNTMNTKLSADADGVRVKNASYDEVITEFTDKGIVSKDIETTGVSKISGLLVMKVDGHIWLTGLE